MSDNLLEIIEWNGTYEDEGTSHFILHRIFHQTFLAPSRYKKYNNLFFAQKRQLGQMHSKRITEQN